MAQIETIVGLHSGSSETYNISAIFGSLNNHLAFSQYFYNFTPTVRPCTMLVLCCSKTGRSMDLKAHQ